MFKRILVFSFVICLTQGVIAQKTDSGWYVAGYSEQIAMNYFTSSTMLEPIEGIWQSTDGYKYAIEKDVENGRRITGKYRVIVLESSYDAWKLGQIKGFVTPGSVDGVYSFKYYTRNANGTNTASQNVFLMMESPVIMTFQRIDGGGKISMFRLFPQVDSGVAGGESSVSQGNSPQWSGSCFVIADKYIATNNHVVEDAKSLVVCGIGGDFSTTYKLQVVATDKNNDLAIVKVVDEKFQGFGMLPYGFNFSTVDVGTEIFALGYPRTQTLGQEVKVTNGIINSKTGYQGDVSNYQMSATIDHGNSGGPVFDYKGNLIAISVAGITDYNKGRNINYAVKSIYLQTLIQSCTEKINVTNRNVIAGFQLSDKIKAITPFVLMILANTETNEGGNTTSGITNGISQSSQMPTQGTNKEKAEFLEKRAREKYGNQDYYGAYADIKESVKLFPKPETHYFRYYLAISVGNDTILAIESLKYCLGNNYELEDCNYALGFIYSRQNKDNEAITHLTSALTENKRNVKALYIRAQCKSKLKDKLGAIADYMQAIKCEGLVDFDYGTIYNNLAYAYLQMNNYELAEKYIKEALNRNHSANYIWDTDGELAYKTGDYDRCIKSMNNAITIEKDENSYYYRILAKIKLNHLQGAYHDIEILKTMNKERADSLMGTIDMSKISFEQEDDYEEIIVVPNVGSKSHNCLYVKAIEQTSEYTAIHFIISTIGTIGYWYNVDESCYILENGNKRYMLKADKIALNPQKSTIGPNSKEEFVLYFPAVEKTCESLDFRNEVGDIWWMKGIQFKSSENTEPWNKPQSTEVAHEPQKSVYIDGYGIDLIWVEGGTFVMGRNPEVYKNTQTVTLSGYYIGKFEVTQGLWRAVMGENPSYFKYGDNYPVENVSWDDCQDFINRLNQKTGKKFRLPTEAEWEYAARGGKDGHNYNYSGSNFINDVAWYDKNSDKKTRQVGLKQANELGIHDMSGNVWEWCYDWYGSYSTVTLTNPTGAKNGSRRVMRGGDWNDSSKYCNVTERFYGVPSHKYNHYGLRLVMEE